VCVCVCVCDICGLNLGTNSLVRFYIFGGSIVLFVKWEQCSFLSLESK
jgi:hypothetical protein